MEENKSITIDVPETVEEAKQALASVPKKKYGHIDKKDEKTIIKGLREFKPLYVIAQELGVCRQTLYAYIRDKMDTSYKDMREAMIDVAEAKLFKNIIDGNQNAIQFFLDRQAKNRGYGEKQMLDRNDVPVINIGRIEIAPPTDTKKVEVIEVKE